MRTVDERVWVMERDNEGGDKRESEGRGGMGGELKREIMRERVREGKGRGVEVGEGKGDGERERG